MSENSGHTREVKGEDISPNKDGGVLKEIIKEGHGDETPSTGDKVSVHYVGTLLDGSKFDSSRDRNDKFEFDLGKGAVIKAWDIGVATMKRGEICRLTCKPEYAYGKQGSGEKIPPDSTLVFEIELFDFFGEDISEDKDKSIIKRVLTKGDGWAKPNDGATVEITLKGIHEGKQFDERHVNFVVGEGFLHNIPPGVEHAISKMAKGETCKLKLKPKAAWADKANAEKFNLPPNSSVDYEVTLVNFDKAKDSWSLSDVEKLEQSELLKKRGGELFKDGHYQVAIKKYSTIVDYLKAANYEQESDKERCQQLKLAAESNIALCHLKLSNFVECIKACDKALEIDAANEKCLFRRATAYQATADYNEAIQDYQAVLKLNASNAAASQGIHECREAIKVKNANDKKLYAKMFAPTKQSTTKTTSKAEGEKTEKDNVTDGQSSGEGQQQNGSGEQHVKTDERKVDTTA